jgi:hypothetical protein
MITMEARPAGRKNIMECRWGSRVYLDLPVQLALGRESVEGRLRNASISGALITTAAELPLFTTLDVRVAVRLDGELSAVDLPALVVRTADASIGVEWRDMGSRQVLALLHEARAQAGVDLFERDHAFG